VERFSQTVRDEVARSPIPDCRYCVKAELSAIFHVAGSIHIAGQQKLSLSLATESAGVARRVVRLLKASYELESEVLVRQVEKLGKIHRYELMIANQPRLIDMLYDLGMLTRDHSLDGNIKPELLKKICCRASFLKGTFLAGGSVTDPQKKTYHLEMVTHNEEFANGLVYLMNLQGMKAKVGLRKDQYLAYLKDSTAIVRFLSIIDAHTAVIKLEEVKVIKGMRGEVNRIVNCETANLEKTLNAAWEQVETINELIRRTGLKGLPSNLQKTAELRLAYPEATLQELGEYHSPPISKSAVNHRLRQIREYAKNFLNEAGIFSQAEKEEKE
jgi:DNA-binding protein WhiA